MKGFTRVFALLVLLLANYGYGLSFIEYPLQAVLDSNDFVLKGVVISKAPLDVNQSTYFEELSLDNFNSEGSCGKCNFEARIEIVKQYKGILKSDTISVLYYPNLMFLLPDFNIGDSVILAINEFVTGEHYVKKNPRYGVKTNNLDIYEKFIESYFRAEDIEQKADWHRRLCIHPLIGEEGLRSYQYSLPKDSLTQEMF